MAHLKAIFTRFLIQNVPHISYKKKLRMHKSSLLEIIRTFTPKEQIKFEDFVNSPYFNKNINVINLFAEIKKYAPEFINENLEKEIVWKKLFLDKKYNYGIMKNLIFDLNKLAIKFLGVENISLKTFEFDLNILDQYQTRALFNFYEKKIQECEKEFGGNEIDTDYYHNRFILGTKKISFLTIKHELKELSKLDFKSLNRDLSLYYFTMFFLKNYNSVQLSFLYNRDFKSTDIDKVIIAYENSEFRDYFSDTVYYIFMSIYEPYNEDNYKKLKKLYYENFDKFSRSNKYNFTIALMNFCKSNSNSGNLFFIKERYQYDKMLTEHDLLFIYNKDYLDRSVFITIVMSATSAGEFDWAEKFIEKYGSKLLSEVREFSVNFAYTNLYFKKKEFEKALSYLSKCEKAEGMDKINIRNYLFFLYYELGYYEELKHLADASRHFFKNDRNISEQSKLEFINFVNTVSRLSDYRYKLINETKDAFDLEEIKKFLSENVSSGKNWFKEKITELENLKVK